MEIHLKGEKLHAEFYWRSSLLTNNLLEQYFPTTSMQKPKKKSKTIVPIVWRDWGSNLGWQQILASWSTWSCFCRREKLLYSRELPRPHSGAVWVLSKRSWLLLLEVGKVRFKLQWRLLDVRDARTVWWPPKKTVAMGRTDPRGSCMLQKVELWGPNYLGDSIRILRWQVWTCGILYIPCWVLFIL